MSDHKTITIKNWYTFPFLLDPDEESNESTSINLQIRRFTVEQGKTFNSNWKRVVDPPSGRLLYRMSSGDEQERVMRLVGASETETFLVEDTEIRRRRVQAMSEAHRAAFLAQEEEDLAFEYDFLVRAVTDHIRVGPGQRVEFDLEDGNPPIVVSSGADLVTVFGGQRKQMTRLGAAVWAENNLSADEKKGWRSRFASRPSWTTPAKAVAGPRPDATATPAGSEASAATADATALPAPTPSGSTVM